MGDTSRDDLKKEKGYQEEARIDQCGRAHQNPRCPPPVLERHLRQCDQVQGSGDESSHHSHSQSQQEQLHVTLANPTPEKTETGPNCASEPHARRVAWMAKASFAFRKAIKDSRTRPGQGQDDRCCLKHVGPRRSAGDPDSLSSTEKWPVPVPRPARSGLSAPAQTYGRGGRCSPLCHERSVPGNPAGAPPAKLCNFPPSVRGRLPPALPASAIVPA